MKATTIPPYVWVGSLGLVLYILLILQAGSGLKFDEPFHIAGVHDLQRLGFGPEFIREIPGASGPLYALLHASLSWLTGLRPPEIRLVNPALFIGLVYLLNRITFPARCGMNMMGVPFVSISIGIALTEMPAMFMLAASLLLLFEALKPEGRGFGVAIAWAAAAGFCLGAAFCGRQNYLIILPAFLALARSGRDLVLLSLVVMISVAMVCPLFVIWHGLVPPFAQTAESGFRFDHGLFAFAYLGLATAVIAPRFFLMPWPWFLGGGLALTLLNGLFHLATLDPMSGLVFKILPQSFRPYWILLASAVLTFAAAVTMIALVRHLWTWRQDRRTLFASAAVGLMLVGCIKVALLISARYVTTALPLWIIALQPLEQNDRWKVWRFAAGIALGAAILWSYLHGGRSDDDYPMRYALAWAVGN